MDDMALLKAYAEEGSEVAFAELVARHLNLVYCTALRRVGNPQLAQDIAQAVFIILARKGPTLRRETILSGWLYRTTRYAAADALKTEVRRRRREQEAHMQQLNEPDANENVWRAVAPVLDDAIAGLSAKDRDAILLRFFERKNFRQIGLVLGLNEDSARMRVTRAVEKLRSLLVKRKVAVPTVTLASLLAAHSVTAAAPGALAATITTATAVKGAAASGAVLIILQGTLKLMAWTKFKTAAVVGVFAVLTVGTVWQKYEIHRAGRGLVTLHAVNTPLSEVMHKIERQSGQTVAWDRRLEGPVTLTVENMPVKQVLDQVILQAGAYWTVDYAVYQTADGLRRLEDALNGGTELRDAGWSNLSSRPLIGEMEIKTLRSDGTVANTSRTMVRPMGTRPTTDGPRAQIRATLAADSEYVKEATKRNKARAQIMQEARDSAPEGPARDKAIGEAIQKVMRENLSMPPNNDPAVLINKAISGGTDDDVLAGERLLAENQLVSRIDEGRPVEATPENARQIAERAQASWAVIYTLRVSPVEHLGLRVKHPGDTEPPIPSGLAENVYQGEVERLTLSPEQRALHAKLLAGLKEKH